MMYQSTECIAMILAGGQGRRLAALTTQTPKPAVPFGGNRLIDFSLSNCCNSGIGTIGVLTTNRPFELSGRIGENDADSIVHTLTPAACSSRLEAYAGTANAIHENSDFIERYNPAYLIVLSGDHVYHMDYRPLVAYHQEKRAEATVAVIEVPWPEASRFGILTARADGAIAEFVEKPARPRSNLASMGVYIFTWSKLKEYLAADEANPASGHDFGKNVIPAMLAGGARLYAYPFDGYWKDVGTVESLYEAHMDLLAGRAAGQAADWPLFPSGQLGRPASLVYDKHGNSLIGGDCRLLGDITGSVIAGDVQVGEKSLVKDSVIMPGVRIGSGVHIERAIIGSGAFIGSGCVVRGNPVAAVSEKSVMGPLRLGPAIRPFSLGA